MRFTGLILVLFCWSFLDAQFYTGNANEIQGLLFEKDSSTYSDCYALEVFEFNHYAGTVKLNNQVYHGIDQLLISGCDEYNIFWTAPSDITKIATASTEDKIYISTSDNGMYVLLQDRIQKLYVDGMNLPQNIRDFIIHNDEIIFNAEDGISALKLSHSIQRKLYTKTGNDLEIAIDTFYQLWVKDGSRLWFDNSRLSVNQLRVELDLLEGKLIENQIELGPQQSLIATVSSNYVGNKDEVSFEYKLDRGSWQRLRDNILYLPGLDIGNEELLLRTMLGESAGPTKLFRVKASNVTKSNAWNYVYGFLGALGLLFLFAFLRERTLRKSMLNKIERTRTRHQMAKTEKKVLQLEMNPHFLFNSLNSIKGLIANGSNREARFYLSKFAKLMRTVLANSKEEYIPIADEENFLLDYLTLEKVTRNDSFDFTVKREDSVAGTDVIPAMILQPFVENAVIHGVRNLEERRGHISVTFRSGAGMIHCIIEDNGTGRNLKADEGKEHVSYATSIAESRLNKHLNEKIEIVDLKNSMGQAIGTKVIVTIKPNSG